MILQGSTYKAITYYFSDGSSQTVYLDNCGNILPVQPPCTDFIDCCSSVIIADETIDFDANQDYDLAAAPVAANKAIIQFQHYDLTGAALDTNSMVLVRTDGLPPVLGGSRIYTHLSTDEVSKDGFANYKFRSRIAPPTGFSYRAHITWLM